MKFYELVNENKIDKVNTPERIIRNCIYRLKDEKYDFCGISAIFSPTFGYLRIVSDIMKEVFPMAIIVSGGGIPSNLMREAFTDCPNIDNISYGKVR